jgi:hypothetical protein
MTQENADRQPTPTPPPPGRGSNPSSGGQSQPVDPADPNAALAARVDQLRKEADARENAEQARKSEEEKKQKEREKEEKEKQDAEAANEAKRLNRIGDGTSWSGSDKIYDNLWGKWYFKGQPVKVAKYENQFGDNISNVSLGTEHLNNFGSQVDMLVNPLLWIKFGSIGAQFGISQAVSAYQRKWSDPTSRPSVPPGVFTAVAGAVSVLGVSKPFLLWANGRSIIQVSDLTDSTYFGTSVEIKRHVDSYEITLQKNAKTHMLAVAALMVGVVFIGIANLIVRLVWYNFEPELADNSIKFDPSKSKGSKTSEGASAADNKTAEKELPAATDDRLSEDWEDRWKYPKIFARDVVPLFETVWAGVLVLLENSLVRQLEWAQWRLKAMKQKLDIAKWDLEELQRRIAVLAMPFAQEGTEELDGLQTEAAELEARVAELEAGITERQAEVDELTTDIQAGEPE